MRRIILPAILALTFGFAPACGSSSSDGSGAAGEGSYAGDGSSSSGTGGGSGAGTGGATSGTSGGGGGTADSGSEPSPGVGTGGSGSDGAGEGGGGGFAGDDGSAAPADSGGSGEAVGGVDGQDPIEWELEPGQLSAGEYRDLDDWAFWRGLFDQNGDQDTAPFFGQEARWGLFTAGRIPVVVQFDGAPVVDARVALMDSAQHKLFEARTDNLGRAELYTGLLDGVAASDLTVTAAAGTAAASMDIAGATGDETVTLTLDADPAAAAKVLDLMFVIDTTGSMGDELNYLQAELENVIETVAADNAQMLDIRVSVNFYRDQGDQYVVRSFPFTTDVADMVDILGMQLASGGGDYPEAVEAALTDAVFDHEWSDDATARLLFLVLDAPPHHTDGIVTELGEAIDEAARLGVRVVPLAASGVDKDTESMLRLMDVATGGTYTFLTDHSGIGNSHIEPTIGDYEVERLNNLLIRVINESVADGAALPADEGGQ